MQNLVAKAIYLLNIVAPAKTVEARLTRVEVLLIVLLLQSPFFAKVAASVIAESQAVVSGAP